jgi:alpha-tubulin suppressor-like RCC1 family protein
MRKIVRDFILLGTFLTSRGHTTLPGIFALLVTIITALSPASLSAQIIAAGGFHSLTVCDDSSASSWGNNMFGSLGNGSNVSSNIPVTVNSLSNIIALAAGSDHSVALTSDSLVWAWGHNGFGQLGNGTNVNSNIPVQVTGLTGITAIALLAGWHSMALKSDGTVWTWGHNSQGQLGNGTNIHSSVPVQVISLTGIKSIGAGYFHSMAVKNDGTVWAWGDNQFGQLGNGTTVNSNVPVQMSAPTGFTSLAGGAGHSIALKSNGTVWMWGDNTYGQYGDGTCNEFHVPIPVSNYSNIIAIAGGADHSMVLKSNGTVWAAGINQWGQLGNGSTMLSQVPVQAIGLTNVVAIDGGAFHSIALKSDGTVWNWGYNFFGQLGNGTNTNSSMPVQVTALCNVTPLPIELLSFTAVSEYQNSSVNLKWKTATEINNDYFSVEKSKDGIHFETIATINGAGNSTQVLNYLFKDAQPFTGINYYRLRQTDYDGQSSVSEIVYVYYYRDDTDPVITFANPVAESINVFLQNPADDFEITIFDLTGKTILRNRKSGIVDVSRLTGGIYFITVHSNENFYSQKFIKQ